MASATASPPSEQQPIRLKVEYRNARSLVTEYTTAVSKGGCKLKTRRPLALDTRFVFEMYAQDDETIVEVEGHVTAVAPKDADGLHEVQIEYLPCSDKAQSLQYMLDRIFMAHKWEQVRRDARIPVNLVAQDPKHPKHRFLVRDLSDGGMGLRLAPDEALPKGLQPGVLLTLTIEIVGEKRCAVAGEVMWTLEGKKGTTQAGMGIRFVPVSERQKSALARLQRLHKPTTLTLDFGVGE